MKEYCEDCKYWKKCENCESWKKDLETFAATGWTGIDRDDGCCNFEIKKVHKKGDSFCHNFNSLLGGGRE